MPGLPTFLQQFNDRFAVAPASLDDAHVAYLGTLEDLRRILSVQVERRLSKNLSCQYQKELLQVQIQGQGLGLRGAKVCLHCHHDGRMEMRWRGRALAFAKGPLPSKQDTTVDAKAVNARVDKALQKRGRTIPPPHHPWKVNAPRLLDKTSPVVALFAHPKGNLEREPPSP